MRAIGRSGLLAVAVVCSMSAAVRLPQVLSSHAVLQRDQPIHVWGWDDPGSTITVTFTGATATAIADRLGHWSAYLPPHSAGGPFTMSVSGSSTLSLDDLLIGDVWFASGQSNMEMPLKGFPGSAVIQNGAEEIRTANHPDIRLLYVPKHASPYPLNEFQGKVAWTVCTPETAASFSAVAYFFGRDLTASEHVPIGLIDSTWGGTPAEAWTSMEGLTSNAALMPAFAAFSVMADEQTTNAEGKQADARDDEAARQEHRPLPKHPWRGDLSSFTPAWLYNAMVAPAADYGIRGAIWYQGESNTDSIRAPNYQQLFAAMISDWRTHWHQGDFPFFFVQLANYAAGESARWPLVREAQRSALQLANTGMAVTIDVGEPDNIHPANKQAVGSRLALAARAVAYHEKLFSSGPLFQQATNEGDQLRVWFGGASGPLQCKAGTLPGFELAGDDHHFGPADAKIDGVTVLLRNPRIQHPKYVRYGWQNSPVLSLFDQSGLPASPFTSEDIRTLR